MRRVGRTPALNGIRGVAILMVVAYHGTHEGVARGGFVGVDVFFVLSGFLITALLLDEWETTGSISLRRFYARRALRLFPALGVFLLACLAILVRVEGDLRTLMVRFVGATTFYVANVFEAWRHDLYWAHTWSLSMEEQYYVVWPALLILLLRRRASRTAVLAVTVALTVGFAALRIALWRTGPFAGDVSFAFYSPFTHADGLLLGCVLGQLWTWDLLPRGARAATATRIAGVLATALLVVAVFVVRPTSAILFDGAYVAITIAAALLVLAALDVQRSPLVRALEWRPLTFTGEISYALYLWNPLFFFNYPGTRFHPVVGAILAYAIAALSFRFVEAPALRLKSRFVGVAHQRRVVVEPARPRPDEDDEQRDQDEVARKHQP